MTVSERRKHYETLWMEALRTYGDDPGKLLPVAQAALKELPGDWQFLYRAAVDAMRIGEVTADPERKREWFALAQTYAQRSVGSDPEERRAQWVLDRVGDHMGELKDT